MQEKAVGVKLIENGGSEVMGGTEIAGTVVVGEGEKVVGGAVVIIITLQLIKQLILLKLH